MIRARLLPLLATFCGVRSVSPTSAEAQRYQGGTG